MNCPMKRWMNSLLNWAHDSEIILLARTLYYGAISAIVVVLLNFDFTGVINETVDLQKAVLLAGAGALLEYLRKRRDEEMK